MKAAVYHAPGDIRISDVPRPTIGEGELLVRVLGVGLCGSDIDKILCGTARPGSILGHEVVGEVAEVGPGVAAFSQGQRVALAHHVSCMDCHSCQNGSFSMCDQFRTTNLDPGGFAEFCRVSAPIVRSATFVIPEGMPLEQAVLTEPLGCCVRAMERCPVGPNDVGVIIGAGSIGLLFTQLMKLAGANVVVSDIAEVRLPAAMSLGADTALNPRQEDLRAEVMRLSKGRGADVVLATVASQRVLDQALSLVRDGGRVHFFAGKRGGLEVSLDINELYEREVALLTTYSSSPPALAEAFRLLESGLVRAAGLISHRLPLAEVSEGVRLMADREALKVYFEVA